jgi:hypothetical protein
MASSAVVRLYARKFGPFPACGGLHLGLVDLGGVSRPRRVSGLGRALPGGERWSAAEPGGFAPSNYVFFPQFGEPHGSETSGEGPPGGCRGVLPPAGRQDAARVLPPRGSGRDAAGDMPEGGTPPEGGRDVPRPFLIRRRSGPGHGGQGLSSHPSPRTARGSRRMSGGRATKAAAAAATELE